MDTEKTKTPLVTVVTATYRHFERLKATIQSVLMQTYPRIEYIICDDASDCFPTDEVDTLIRNVPETIESIRIIRQKTNVGTVRNLNSAYLSSKGEIIINLSCGDSFFEPQSVKKIVQFFLEHKSKVVVSSRVLFRGDYEPECLLPHYGDRKEILALDTALKQYKAFMLGNASDMASGSAMHFSKAILEELGYFDENYRLWEDGPFLAKFLWKYKLDFAYEIISIWYEDGGVSAGGVMNPLLYQDTVRFDETEKRAHLECFSRREKRMLRFLSKLNHLPRTGKKRTIRKMIICVCYLDVYLKKKLKAIRRNAQKERDCEIVNRSIANLSDEVINCE